jgi:hypothetical protein
MKIMGRSDKDTSKAWGKWKAGGGSRKPQRRMGKRLRGFAAEAMSEEGDEVRQPWREAGGGTMRIAGRKNGSFGHSFP